MSIPPDKMFETIRIAVIGVLSFIGGQFWGIGKTLYRERKLKRALQTEIEEMSPWLLRNVMSLECMIQLSCLNELANHMPAPIPTQVHSHHFAEINLKLSTAEKTSINAIYNLAFRVNKDLAEVGDLYPICAIDSSKFRSLAMILDTAYRNANQALLLIQLHKENIDDLESITTSEKTNVVIQQLTEKNDADLLRLAAEAKKEGAAAIRRKHKDGAVSSADVAPTPAPMPGRFYFDGTGAKYKCLSVQNEVVTSMLLESQVGSLTFDAMMQQPLASIRHWYEITDPDEKARLERRCGQLTASINPKKPR
jgi:hypothetical protein